MRSKYRSQIGDRAGQVFELLIDRTVHPIAKASNSSVRPFWVSTPGNGELLRVSIGPGLVETGSFRQVFLPHVLTESHAWRLTFIWGFQGILVLAKTSIAVKMLR